MKPRLKRLAPLLLLLFASCTSHALDVDSLLDSQILRRSPQLSSSDSGGKAGKAGKAGKPARPDIGTKDAPVDGRDGKPHAGPFIDSTSTSSSTQEKKKTSSTDKDNAESSGLAEDGVMNDPNRVPAKDGTKGTEGGVSEKTRNKEAHETETGKKKAQTPSPPKDPEKVAHKEDEDKKTSSTSSSYEGDKRKDISKEDGKFPKLDPEKGLKDTSSAKEKSSSSSGEFSDSKSSSKDTPSKDSKSKSAKYDPPPPRLDLEYPIPKEKSASDDDSSKSSTSKKGSKNPKNKNLYTDTAEDSFTPPHENIYTDSESEDNDLIPWDALTGSFASIAATEIGDKTFIVAALMAMRHPRIQVFTAAYSALVLMTILSGVTGHAVGSLISKRWSAFVAALLFLVFGAKSLREGMAMRPDQGVSDEIREVQAELEEKEVDMLKNSARATNGAAHKSDATPEMLESGRVASISRSRSRSRKASALHRSPSPTSSTSPSPSPSRRSSSSWRPAAQRASKAARTPVAKALAGIKNLLGLLLSPAWVETFSMTFIGELGDRSQIATVAMAAGQEYWWVMVGACAGHFICTGGAVLGGSVLAGRVSLRKGMSLFRPERSVPRGLLEKSFEKLFFFLQCLPLRGLGPVRRKRIRNTKACVFVGFID